MAGKRKKNPGNEAEVHNRRARHDYAIESTLEVGIKLHGTEVKSVRMGEVSIAEGYIRATSEPPDHRDDDRSLRAGGLAESQDRA